MLLTITRLYYSYRKFGRQCRILVRRKRKLRYSFTFIVTIFSAKRKKVFVYVGTILHTFIKITFYTLRLGCTSQLWRQIWRAQNNAKYLCHLTPVKINVKCNGVLWEIKTCRLWSFNWYRWQTLHCKRTK